MVATIVENLKFVSNISKSNVQCFDFWCCLLCLCIMFWGFVKSSGALYNIQMCRHPNVSPLLPPRTPRRRRQWPKAVRAPPLPQYALPQPYCLPCVCTTKQLASQRIHMCIYIYIHSYHTYIYIQHIYIADICFANVHMFIYTK